MGLFTLHNCTIKDQGYEYKRRNKRCGMCEKQVLSQGFSKRNAKMGVMEWDAGSPTKTGGWLQPRAIECF